MNPSCNVNKFTHNNELCAITLFLFLAFTNTAWAGNVDEIKTKLRREISAEIKDSELIEQLVEIRFKREFSKIKSEVEGGNQISSESKIIKTLEPINVPIVNSFKSNSIEKHQIPLTNDVTFSVASTTQASKIIAIDHASNISDKFTVRFGLKSNLDSKPTQYESTNLIKTNTFQTAGIYLDWHPNAGDFKISAGITGNNVKSKFNSANNSLVNINGKITSSEKESLSVVYKFPKYTPYLGVGIDTSKNNNPLKISLDFGLMIGKYEGFANTNLIGSNDISVQDLDAEMNKMRQSITKRNFTPIGSLGIKYAY